MQQLLLVFVTTMKEPTYRQAVSHGWHIATRHPLLWIFGFFAAFLGQLGLMDFVVQMSLAQQQFAWYPLLFQWTDYLRGIIDAMIGYGFSGSQILWGIWMLIFALGVVAFLAFISVSSQGALIHGIAQSIGVRKRKQINVAKAWHAGTGHFWRLFALAAIKKLAIGGLALLLGFSLYNAVIAGQHTGELTIYFLLYLVVSAIGVIVSLLTVYAAGYVVIEEYSFWDALHEAWYLFREHWLVSLEIGAMVLLANIVAHAVVLMLGVFILIEMAILWAIALAAGSALMWMLMMLLGGFVLVIGMAFVGTLLSVFTTSMWTYLFMKMHHKGVKSRILHVLGR